MSLNRAEVTAASRVMLPAYVLLFATLGIVYGFTSEGRLIKSPGLAYADDLMPLPVWGGMFAATALILAAALLSHHRFAARYALWLGIVCMTIWSLMFVAAAILGDASPSAWTWPAFVATACFATNRSLRRGEGSGRERTS